MPSLHRAQHAGNYLTFNISFILHMYPFSSVVYSFYVEALNILNMMCINHMFVHALFRLWLNFLERKVFVYENQMEHFKFSVSHKLAMKSHNADGSLFFSSKKKKRMADKVLPQKVGAFIYWSVLVRAVCFVRYRGLVDVCV